MTSCSCSTGRPCLALAEWRLATGSKLGTRPGQKLDLTPAQRTARRRAQRRKSWRKTTGRPEPKPVVPTKLEIKLMRLIARATRRGRRR